jgi:amino acid transporter
MDKPVPQAPVAPRLGLWDAVSIIIGIVVGTAIFKSPMMVFQNVAGPWQALAAWLAGGLLSFCGALCYAELATTYPRNGGDYEYLNRAYGRWLGFLFGWAQLTVILSASIGTMAYAFADYGVAIWPSLRDSAVWLAVAAVVALSALNALGVVAGKTAQNVLSVIKVSGLAIVVLAGLWASTAAPSAPAAPFSPSIGLAMVFILYSYGGWNDAVFVAAEVRDPRRNLPRALLVGILSITAIYLAVNAAYLAVLGFDAARQSPTPAADVLQHSFGNWGRNAISVLVMISALGAINGMILTGSRVYATLGADYPIFAWLASWNRRTGAPLAAIAIQAIAAVLLILSVGTATGRALVDAGLGVLGAPSLPWDEYFGGFETLLAGSAPIFWAFFLLTGVAVVLLRTKQPAAQRPFSIPLYPLPLVIFCATCLYMLYSSVVYARWLVLVVATPLVLGAALWFLIRGRDDK